MVFFTLISVFSLVLRPFSNPATSADQPQICQICKPSGPHGMDSHSGVSRTTNEQKMVQDLTDHNTSRVWMDSFGGPFQEWWERQIHLSVLADLLRTIPGSCICVYIYTYCFKGTRGNTFYVNAIQYKIPPQMKRIGCFELPWNVGGLPTAWKPLVALNS